MAKQFVKNRVVAVKDFWGPGKHVYEDQLGWTMDEKKEVGSLVSKKIFEVEIVEVGLNLAFYYIDDDTFYGIHTECYPIECKILPRDRTEMYIGWQCNARPTPMPTDRSLHHSMMSMTSGTICGLAGKI